MDCQEEETVPLTEEEIAALDKRIKELGHPPLLAGDVTKLTMPQGSTGQLEFCYGGESWAMTFDLQGLKDVAEAVAHMVRQIEAPGPGFMYCRRILRLKCPVRERRIDGR